MNNMNKWCTEIEYYGNINVKCEKDHIDQGFFAIIYVILKVDGINVKIRVLRVI